MSQTLQEEENINAEEFGVLKDELQKHIPISGFGDATVLCSTRVCASIHNCSQISVCTGLNRPCHLPCPCTSLCCSVCVSFLVCRNNLPKGKVHNMNFGISTIPSFLTNSVKLCSIHLPSQGHCLGLWKLQKTAPVSLGWNTQEVLQSN